MVLIPGYYFCPKEKCHVRKAERSPITECQDSSHSAWHHEMGSVVLQYMSSSA